MGLKLAGEDESKVCYACENNIGVRHGRAYVVNQTGKNVINGFLCGPCAATSGPCEANFGVSRPHSRLCVITRLHDGQIEEMWSCEWCADSTQVLEGGFVRKPESNDPRD